MLLPLEPLASTVIRIIVQEYAATMWKQRSKSPQVPQEEHLLGGNYQELVEPGSRRGFNAGYFLRPAIS